MDVLCIENDENKNLKKTIRFRCLKTREKAHEMEWLKTRTQRKESKMELLYGR